MKIEIKREKISIERKRNQQQRRKSNKPRKQIHLKSAKSKNYENKSLHVTKK